MVRASGEGLPVAPTDVRSFATSVLGAPARARAATSRRRASRRRTVPSPPRGAPRAPLRRSRRSVNDPQADLLQRPPYCRRRGPPRRRRHVGARDGNSEHVSRAVRDVARAGGAAPRSRRTSPARTHASPSTSVAGADRRPDVAPPPPLDAAERPRRRGEPRCRRRMRAAGHAIVRGNLRRLPERRLGPWPSKAQRPSGSAAWAKSGSVARRRRRCAATAWPMSAAGRRGRLERHVVHDVIGVVCIPSFVVSRA